MGKTVLLITV